MDHGLELAIFSRIVEPVQIGDQKLINTHRDEFMYDNQVWMRLIFLDID